jgi:hypothetical protein
MSDFASFWKGPVDGIAYGCFASFPYFGAKLTVYTYDENIALPPGVELGDAREICPDLTSRYLANGQVAFAKFANLFRYLLLQQRDVCWVDADMLCLAPPTFQNDDFVFGRQYEDPGHIWVMNNAALKLPPDSAILSEMIAEARAVEGLSQHWGVIGPELLSRLTRKHGLTHLARPLKDFYALEPGQFWMLLLPSERPQVERIASSSKLLHLWNNNFSRADYDKWLAPPEGSYLHHMFERVGALSYFKGVYSENDLFNKLGDWLPDEKIWTSRPQLKRLQQLQNDIIRLNKTNEFLISLIAGAANSSADTDRLLRHEWQWFDGVVVKFERNGDVIRNNVLRGKWRAAPRDNAVLVSWFGGEWIDLVTLSDDVLTCENNVGASFVVRPLA